MRYPARLLSVGFSPCGMVRVVGTSNGAIYMRQKNRRKAEGNIGTGTASEIDGYVQEPKKNFLRPTNFRYFRRGQNEKPHETDYIIQRPAKVKLSAHDKLLKQFRHKEALVAVLSKKNPISTLAVMEELVARKKLLICVQNLEINELELPFRFLNRYVTVPQYARVLMDLENKVLKTRTDDILSSSELKVHVRNIKNVIAEEI